MVTGTVHGAHTVSEALLVFAVVVATNIAIAIDGDGDGDEDRLRTAIDETGP